MGRTLPEQPERLPLAVERGLLEDVYRLANKARHLIHATPETCAHVREHADELCTKAAEVRSAVELEAARLMDAAEKEKEAK